MPSLYPISVVPFRIHFTVTAIFLLIATSGGSAQENVPLVDRIKEVTSLLQNNQLLEARPKLISMRSEVPQEMQVNFDFYLALSYVFEFYEKADNAALKTASTKFKEFIDTNPNHSLVALARYNLADCYAINRDFEKALSWYIPLYRNPSPGVDRNDVLKKIVLIYAAEQKWEAGIPYFKDRMNRADNPVDRTTASAYLLIGKAKQGDMTDTREILEFFSHPSPVFFSPRFNAALMEVGDQLRIEGDFATAILFYKFVRSYENVEVGLKAQIAQLEAKAARYADNVALRNFYIESKAELDNAKANLKALQTSENYTPLLNWRIARILMDIGRDWEAFWRFRKMVDQYPEHRHAETILYSAYSLSRRLGRTDMQQELAKRYLEEAEYTNYRSTVADQNMELHLAGQDFDAAYRLTLWYLEQSPNDDAATSLLFKHGMTRLERMENRELIREFEQLKETHSTAKTAPIIDYFLGISHLIEQENQQALDYMERVLAAGPTDLQADAAFRKAQAVLGLERTEEARDLVVKFIAQYPGNPLRATAEIMLGDVINLQGNANEALKHYYQVGQFTTDRALLEQAELKISRILVDQQKADQAIERLTAFVEEFSEYSETISVSAALARIHTDSGAPRVALGILKDALDRFFKLTEIDAIDPIIVDYIQKDRMLRRMRTATDEFLATIANDPERLRELVEDRAKQYRFFKENPDIDTVVKESFVRDDAFRKTVLKDTEKLATLEARIDKLNRDIPEVSANKWVEKALEKAYADNNTALIVRTRAALASAEEPTQAPSSDLLRLLDDSEKWQTLPAAGKLWILSEKAKKTPERVITTLEAHRLEFANTDYELEHLQLLAECYRDTDQLEASIETYQRLINRFSHLKASGEAALEIGQMQIRRGNAGQARQILETILNREQWRGEMQAKALLWIGRSYAAEGKFPEAHGFFERIMLGYPGFNQLLATAYYEDIIVLKKMGETESAQTVYEAFQLTPGLDETEMAKRIRKEFEK